MLFCLGHQNQALQDPRSLIFVISLRQASAFVPLSLDKLTAYAIVAELPYPQGAAVVCCKRGRLASPRGYCSCFVQAWQFEVTQGVNGMLQADEVAAARELVQRKPYLAESVQCPVMSASEPSINPWTEGTQNTSAGHTVQSNVSEQRVRACSVVCCVGSMPAVTTSTGKTAESPEAAAVTVISKAAAAAMDLAAAAATNNTKATAITVTSEAPAAPTAATATTATTAAAAAAAITAATATTATNVEAMAVSVVQAVAESADGRNLLPPGQSTACAMHVPGCAQPCEVDSASIAIGVVEADLTTIRRPVRSLTELPAAEADAEAAAAETAAPTQQGIAMMPKGRCFVQLAARAAYAADASVRPGSSHSETDAPSIAPAAVSAQIAGMGLVSANSTLQADSAAAEGTDHVQGPGIVVAQEAESALEPGSAEAEGIDKTLEAGSVEAEGIGWVPEAGCDKAEGIDSVTEPGSAEAEEIDIRVEAGSVKAEGLDIVCEAGCDEAEEINSAPEAGSDDAEGIDNVSEAGSTEVEGVDRTPGSAEAQRIYSASASDSAVALTANAFADLAELLVTSDSGATDESDVQMIPEATGEAAHLASIAVSSIHASSAGTESVHRLV